MRTKIHAIAGVISLLTIMSFWISTVFAEMFGTFQDISQVKQTILLAMLFLIPSMIITGVSGFKLAGKRTNQTLEAKQLRMRAAGFNGLFCLLPCAFFLAHKSETMSFDLWFYGIQGIELFAGGLNITLLILNMKDGLLITSQRLTRLHSLKEKSKV